MVAAPVGLFWTILGTMWYAQVQAIDPMCMDGNNTWVMIFCLGIAYFLLLVYVISGIACCIEIWRVRERLFGDEEL